MARSTLAFATLPLVLLAACGSQPGAPANDAMSEAVPNTTDAAPPPADNKAVTENAAAAPVAAASLAAYDGKAPYDKVAGKTFTETDAVKAAIATSGATTEVRKWLADTGGPASPIAMQGGKLVMNECQEHNCGDHNWTIAIAPDGTGPEICYYDAKAGPKPIWFVDGKPADRPAAGDAGCIQPAH